MAEKNNNGKQLGILIGKVEMMIGIQKETNGKIDSIVQVNAEQDTDINKHWQWFLVIILVVGIIIKVL